MEHVMRIMGSEGDVKLIWDTEKKAEVDAARDTFNKMIAKKYKAFAVKKGGGQGEMIDKFDPEMEKIILAAPISGGEMATIEYDGTATWNYSTTLAGSSTNLATSNKSTIWSDGTGNTANIVYRTEPVQPHVPTAEEQVAQVERTRDLTAAEHDRIVT